MEGCVSKFGAAILPPPRLAALVEAIDAGRVVFDPVAAEDCASQMATDLRSTSVAQMLTGLRLLFEATPACVDLLVGTVEMDGSCTLDDECVSGLVCDFAGESCGGTCVPDAIESRSVPAGGTCTEAEECMVGLTCFEEDQKCRSFGVEADLGEGAPCFAIDSTDTSLSIHVCAPGLGCAQDGMDMICAVRLEAGATCAVQDACAQGYFCLPDDPPSMTHSCQVLVFETEVGADCSLELEGPLVVCDASRGLHCGPDGTCLSIGDGGEGAPCYVDGTYNLTEVVFECDSGFYCHPIDLVCTAKLDDGVDCVLDGQCQSGTCLDGSCAEAYCDVHFP